MSRLSAASSRRLRYGLAAAAFVVAAALSGGRALWYIAYSFAFAAALSLAHAYLGLRRVKAKVSAPPATLLAGDEILMSYELENAGRFALPGLHIAECSFAGPGRGAGSPGGRAAALKPVPLEPGKLVRWESRVRLSRRGLYERGDAWLAMRDLYGLFELKRRIASPLSIVVRPRLSYLAGLAPEGLRQPGELQVRDPYVRDPAELAELREYRPGDPLRLIHWRLSAKTGRTVVKRFERRGDAIVELALDPEAARYPDGAGLDDLGAEVAASLAAYFLGRGARLGLGLEAGAARLGGDDERALPPVLDALARFTPKARPGSFSALIRETAAAARTGAAVVAIGPSLGRAEALALIEAKLAGLRPAFVWLAGPGGAAGAADLRRAEAEPHREPADFADALAAEDISRIVVRDAKELGHALAELRV